MNDSTDWSEYERRYGPELAKDGAGDGYAGSPRIVVVLKEPNNSAGADLRCDFLNAGPKWAIWHRVAEWAAGMLDGFPPFADLQADAALKASALRRIAVINLKKCSGGASIDGATVQRFAFRDRDLLRAQIAALEPTRILACGTFEPLLWLLEDRIPPEADPEQPVLTLTDGAVLVRWRHPARVTHPGECYEGLRARFESIQGAGTASSHPVTPGAPQ